MMSSCNLPAFDLHIGTSAPNQKQRIKISWGGQLIKHTLKLDYLKLDKSQSLEKMVGR